MKDFCNFDVIIYLQITMANVVIDVIKIHAWNIITLYRNVLKA